MLEMDLNQLVVAAVVPVLQEEMVIPHKKEVMDLVDRAYSVPQHSEILHKVLDHQDQQVTG